MTLRDVLIVLDGSLQSEIQLAVAIDLARRTGAHLTGLCPLDALVGIHPSIVVGPYPQMYAFPEAVHDFLARAKEKAQAMEERFQAKLRGTGISGEWQVATGLPAEAIVEYARRRDLLILGQADPRETSPLRPGNLVEDALMGAGRPLLLVPYAGHFEKVGSNVLVGWDGSQEAARAIHDMLLVVEPGAAVAVLTVADDRHREGQREPPGADMVSHLARHGLAVTATSTVRSDDISKTDVLLNYASDIGADLLVVGGYGHSRIREILLGGVTRALLQQMTLPVLMSR